MNQINLYWSTYLNIEKEVVELANKLHFNDKQLDVYSMYIGELLIRCSVEIESLSKELYYKFGGEDLLDEDNKRELYFDTDCLLFLENKFKLSKKEVIITAYNMYFQEHKNKNLQPLNKAHKRGKCHWKMAYQAVKHDRNNSLHKATIQNLLNALGSLYILNIYYKFENIYLGKNNFKQYENIENSIIFTPLLLNATSGCKNYFNLPNENEKVEKSILIYKFTHKSFFENILGTFKDEIVRKRNMNESTKVQEFLIANPQFADKPNLDILCKIAINDPNIFTKINTSNHEINAWINGSTELILNINTPIYTLSEEEALQLKQYIN